MTAPIKKETKDPAHIGDQAAQQPLSGTSLVSRMNFKGFNGVAFTRVEETKKAG